MLITACSGKPLDHVSCPTAGASLPQLCSLASSVIAPALDTATLTD